jgi:hypothetical protein
MSDSCLCGQGMNNTGLATCLPAFKKTTGLFLVPLFANDGTRNSIDMSTAINLTAKIQNTDKSKRFYPIQDLKDVELPVADAKFKTYKDGAKRKLADGIRSFKATMPETSSVLIGKLQGVSCSKFGVYLIDIDGQLRGIKDGTKLYPVEIGGFNAIFKDATDDEVHEGMIEFDFDILLKISKFWILSSTDLNVNPNEVSGLIDANLTVGTITSTGVSISVNSDFGSGVATTMTAPIVGLTSTNWSLTRTDTNADVPLSSVTEGADGVYALVYSAITGATVPLRARVKTISGFDGYADYIDA